jgi:hypothetical protein
MAMMTKTTSSPLAPWKFETTRNLCAAHPLFRAAFRSNDTRRFSILYDPVFKSQLLLQAFATECGAIGWMDGIGFHVAGKRIRWCFYGVLARLLEIWIFVIWGLA